VKVVAPAIIALILRAVAAFSVDDLSSLPGMESRYAGPCSYPLAPFNDRMFWFNLQPR
jgi:hypothetical protein